MKKIAIITGGESKEREISLLSAKNMCENLNSSLYEVKVYIFPEEKQSFLEEYDQYDLIIPMIHGIGGEDGAITAFLEFVGKKYLFSTSGVHKLCLNKYLSGLLVKNSGFLTPKTFLVRNIQDLENISYQGKIFVKPCNGGSSVDNGVFANIDKAQNLVEKILSYDEVLIQEFIVKQREFSVSITNDFDKKPEILAISEVITQKEIFDYDAKYKADGAVEIVHADLDTGLKNEIEKIALALYTLFQVKTFARIDMIYENEKLYFLEINTIPGFTAMSFVPQAILSSGKSIGEFLEEVINVNFID
ncbi:MAG: ATP-grasp domain-containing protein [Candidatus Altimarinota bacterium]